MNQKLSEQILASVLDWDTQEIADNIRSLEDFAELKYDQYQQYQVGSRFMENLTLWLYQFETLDERCQAFDFVKDRIVFISQGELYHLINSIYPDLMRPLFKKSVRELSSMNGIRDVELKREILKVICRQSLILGLSDGARLDVFRRGAPAISNEQVLINYEIKEERMTNIIKKMKKDTDYFYRQHSLEGMSCDNILNVFLMDDFSGSGISYLRQEEDENQEKQWDGKIVKVIKQLEKQMKNIKDITIHVILYLATPRARKHIEEYVEKYHKDREIKIEVHVLQEIHEMVPTEQMELLMRKYYDSRIQDSHYEKGKHDKPFLGFDECSLPVVLYHNTPNNSFPIIWGMERSLFPRITRHKDVS